LAQIEQSGGMLASVARAADAKEARVPAFGLPKLCSPISINCRAAAIGAGSPLTVVGMDCEVAFASGVFEPGEISVSELLGE
jgi:hypothetical protein